MMLPVHQTVRKALARALTEVYDLAPSEHPVIVLELPPRRALGDLAVPVAFELARRLRKAPRVIAQELARALTDVAGIARVEAAPNGYLNLYLDRPAFLRARLAPAAPPAAAAASDKTIVEHTAINPNKAAHIGHLRNATLGDTLVRLLRFQGRSVEVQNYIDDTGVQVADVVVGFTALEARTPDGVLALADDPAGRFDYYCWDLYARVGEWYEQDPSRLQARAEALHAIETGGNPLAEMAAIIADRIVRCHLRTMARLDVDYDLLTWEGDILKLHFWSAAFEELKRRDAVFLQTQGRLAGCWVMPIEEPGGDASADEEPGTGATSEDEPREKVIVRSNGTVTYVGKDIANQFWKFGLLGKDFHYRVFQRQDGRTLWATTADPAQAQVAPAFGQAASVYNVIDSRQAYLQQLLKQALATIGFAEQAANSTHFSYEMVALSHATARRLGYDDVESQGKPFVEVSGRRGLGVKADDLLDQLVESADREVEQRHPHLAADERRRTAEIIGVAALRYFLVKFSRGKLIVFDIDEALSFEGETGPYLQYSVVRARNILAKLAERDGVSEATLVDRVATLATDPLESGAAADELWDLVLEAARLDEVVDGSVRGLELAQLAKYAFGLAQAFNAFYHSQQVMREPEEAPRLWRAAAVAYVRRQLTLALDLMGCDVPDRM